MTVLRACTALTAAFFLFATNVQALPFEQAPQQQAREKTPEPVTGQIVSVDTDARTLVIKAAGDTEMKFSISDQTVIVGADKGASGLAAASGATVKITYDTHGTANVATRIEVLPKK